MTSSHPSLESIHRSVRATNPLVHCLTNSVVQEITADVLLAVGASPAMVSHPEEAEQFAAVASAVLVNVGNPDPPMIDAMRSAVKVARELGTPWVLDPVAVGGLTVRTELASSLVYTNPAVIRANASEVINLHAAVTRTQAQGGRGVDSTDCPESALEAASALAEITGGVVAISGATDIIVSAHRITKVSGGSELMPLVIGTGCSLGAVVAAYTASTDNYHDAAVAAHAAYTTAAEHAAKHSNGPGTFHAQWIDALYASLPNTAGIEES